MTPPRNRKSKALNLITILFIVLILMAGAYYYFFHGLKGTGELISNLSNQSDALMANQSSLDSLKEIFSDTSEDREKLNSRFVQNEEAIDFISIIENLAAFGGLSGETESVSTMDIDPPSDHYELLHLTFRTKGSWQNTFYFLSLLETLPYNLTLNQFNSHDTGDTSNQSLALEDLGFSSSTSSSTTKAKSVIKKASIWESTFDFTVMKLK